MKISLKLTKTLIRSIRTDLSRAHSFAAERVGFISCKVAELPEGGLIITANGYHPVADADYLYAPSVGAMMNSAAIRKALQISYSGNMCMFHVHMHEHWGTPRFSKIDLTESEKFIPDFWNVQPALPHGILVLSHNSATALCWLPDQRRILPVSDITIVGSPLMRLWERLL